MLGAGEGFVRVDGEGDGDGSEERWRVNVGSSGSKKSLLAPYAVNSAFSEMQSDWIHER